MGITNAINLHLTNIPDNFLRGRLFEQFIVLETDRLLKYLRSEARLFYWRTNTGAEVDLLIEKGGTLSAAFEIKAKKQISGADFSGLKSFKEDNPDTDCFLVCEVSEPFQERGIHILPWRNYLERLPEFFQYKS